MRPIRSSLSTHLTCPRCTRRQGSTLDAESFRALVVCYRRDCGQRWWAMALSVGMVEPQLVYVFGSELARENMQTWGLPLVIDQPMLWQLSLSNAQHAAHGGRGSIHLIRALLRLMSRAPNVAVGVASLGLAVRGGGR